MATLATAGKRMTFWQALHWREPLWLLLALFPLLLAAWGYFQQRRQAQTYADPHLLPWVQVIANQHSWRKWLSPQTLWAIAWVLFAISLAGPRIPQTQPDDLRPAQFDVLVVLDISRSMQATDLAPNRLQRAALELHELLGLAQGSRVGIVVYGARPHLFAPLTNDANAVRFYLQHLETLVLPTLGTDHAAALDFAQQELAAREQALPAAVLWITDGDIPADQHAALQTRVQILQTAGIPLYSLGVGTEDGEAIPLPGGKWLEHDGQAVRSRHDSALLQNLSAQAGGAYSAVKDDASDWQMLYTKGIAQAFPAQAEAGQQWRELYVWTLLAAMGLLFVWLATLQKTLLR
ncbi:vWA domain-containing protein [Candidatus Thiothrix anitrata]|uniref:VWA domain-containing protein n=1 Tax=Candidatus Thiothrix anitrata TaxID=2823902 RepID=A0ABX7X8A5_9GAMM|nr:VWA domain-containing protein [Candidatus Thiothrix anitrata]QTR50910.1 VWA domain-containing protein [Candidatus Thiothrix anitrata]